MADEKAAPAGAKDKKDGKEEEEKVIPKIVYIGQDISYFNNLKEKFQELCSIEAEFQSSQVSDDSKIQSQILKIRTIKPKAVLLDFAKNPNAMMHLARLWQRQNKTIETSIIGLCDYTQGRSMVIKAIMTTIPCVHIKSAELEAVVHDINCLSFPLLVQDHGFALAELSDPIKAYFPAKAALINDNFLKIESNVPMQAKQQLRVHNFWFRSKVVESNLVMCASQSQENLYYNFEYTQILQMAHADPVQQTDNMTKEDFDKLQKDRQEKLQNSKFKLTKWIKEHVKYSKPKFLKAYVVDKEGHFFNDRPLSDTYIYVFRNQPFVKDAKKELLATKPQIIVWNLEKVSKADRDAEAELQYTLNDMPNLIKFAKDAKEVFQGYQPIIIVFNAEDQETADLQASMNYQSVLAVKDPMSIDMVLRMCEMLRNKVEPSLPKPNATDVYIDKNSDISYVEIESELTLMACSENDVYFNSDQDLPLGTVLRVSLPVPMYITVCKIPEYAKISSTYYGIIHGIGEEERQKLRRYINEIFFRDHEQKKAEEKQEVEQLKVKYVEDKEKDAQDAAAAEAERLRKEEEERKALEEKAKELVGQLDDKKEEK